MDHENYFGGREHAIIKHYFLEKYLEVLCFKTLLSQSGTRPEFTYIDGFTGPWGARNDQYLDTSFGVALEVLNRVKSRLPDVKLKAVFCEVRRKAFAELQEFVSKNAGEVEVQCLCGRFENHIEVINSFVGPNGFRFAFIDPKGFKVDTSAIKPLLVDSWSEVVFNFMAEFAGRFPDFEQVGAAYASLLGDVNWRGKYEALPEVMSNDDKILQMFREVLKENWRFDHVLELPVRKPNRDRIFYKLVYGTRSPHGVLEFRKAQWKAEREGHAVAFESATSITGDLFSSDVHAENMMGAAGVGSKANFAIMQNLILEQLSNGRTQNYLTLAANVLEVAAVREVDFKNMIRDMGRSKVLSFSEANKLGLPTHKSLIKM